MNDIFDATKAENNFIKVCTFDCIWREGIVRPVSKKRLLRKETRYHYGTQGEGKLFILFIAYVVWELFVTTQRMPSYRKSTKTWHSTLRFDYGL